MIVSVREQRPLLPALQYVEGMDLASWAEFIAPTEYHGVEVMNTFDVNYLAINKINGATFGVLTPGSWAIWRESENRVQLMTDEHFRKGFYVASES